MAALSRKRLIDKLVEAYVDWREACVQVDDADHLMLGPFDFDLRNSTIRGPEQTWLSVWVLGGGAAEGQRMRVTRLAREAQDAAAAAAWA